MTSKVVESKSVEHAQDKQLPKKSLKQAKLVHIDAAEQEFINAASETFQASVEKKELPSGAVEMKDMNTALIRSLNESTTLLLDWDGEKCRSVGFCCKVYWDGEEEWFDARILNYDPYHDKYYIYYFEDSTAEWISISQESVLIATELVLARVDKSDPHWPAMLFRASEGAVKLFPYMASYVKGGIYTEFFNEKKKSREYGFVKEDSYLPVHQENMLKKPTKKYSAAIDSMAEERCTIDAVKESLKKNVRNTASRRLSGEQWVGAKVRAFTHRVLTKAEKARLPPLSNAPGGYCKGIVMSYCPSIDKHFIVFGEKLQPLWTRCNDGEVELLLDVQSDNAEEDSSIVASSKPAANENIQIENLMDVEQAKITCALCSSISSVEVELLNYCNVCHKSYHKHCLPQDKGLRPLNPDHAVIKRSPNSWTCYNCTTCQGCSVSCWNAPLMHWNVQRVDKQAAERWILVCGVCLAYYKHHKSFCPICYKLYTVDDSTTLTRSKTKVSNKASAKPTKKQKKKTSQVSEVPQDQYVSKESSVVEDFSTEPTVAPSFHNPTTVQQNQVVECSIAATDAVNTEKIKTAETSEESVEESTDLNEDCMVQCNECCRWVHAECEGLDHAQYMAIALHTHPIWGDEYLCPICRIKISTKVIHSLAELDKIGMFAQPVTEAVARNYFDIIRSPMDLQTMLGKSKNGQYKALQAVRQDFELMCYNALLFNQPNDEYYTAALFFLRSGTKMLDGLKRRTKATAYFAEAQKIVEKQNPPLEKVSKVSKSVAKANSRKRHRWYVTVDENGEELKEGQIEEQKEIDEEGVAKVRKVENNEEELLSSGVSHATDPSHLPIASAEASSSSDMFGDLSSIAQALQLTVPFALTPICEPNSYLAPTMHLLPVEDAYFQACNDTCFICGSCGDKEFMIFCVDCGEAFHTFCANVPVDFLKTIQEPNRFYNWRCMNCKICGVCDQVSHDDGDNLIFCEKCDASYHTNCLNPPISTVKIESRNWYCSSCVACVQCDQNGKKTSAWGHCLDLCIDCLQSSHLCLHCENEISSDEEYPSYLSCEECQGKIHIECYGYRDCAALVRIGRLKVLCTHCNRNYTSISPVNQVWQRVSVMKIALEERKRLSDMAKEEEMVSSKVKENKMHTISMIIWATIRIMLIGKGTERSVNEGDTYAQFYKTVSNFSTSTPSNVLINTFARARRFLNYFKRSEKLGARTPMKGGQLLGVKLLQLEGHALSVLCNQASSFVCSSDLTQRNDMRRLSEALIVLVEVVLILASANHPSETQASLSLSSLNHAFKCITKLHPVTQTSSLKALNMQGRYKEVHMHEKDFELLLKFTIDFLAKVGGLTAQNIFVVKDFLDKTYRQSCSRNLAQDNTVVSQGVSVPGAQRVYYVVNTLLLQGFEEIMSSQLFHNLTLDSETGQESSVNVQSSIGSREQKTDTSKPTVKAFNSYNNKPLLHSIKHVVNAEVASLKEGSSALFEKSSLGPAEGAGIEDEVDIVKPKGELLRTILRSGYGSEFLSTEVVALLHQLQHRVEEAARFSTEGEASESRVSASARREARALAKQEHLRAAVKQMASDAVEGNIENNGASVEQSTGVDTEKQLHSSMPGGNGNVDNSLPMDLNKDTEQLQDGSSSGERKDDPMSTQIASFILDKSSNSDVKPQVLEGWNSRPEVFSDVEWLDTRLCALCHSGLEDDWLGRMLPFSHGSNVHINCLLWCPEISISSTQYTLLENAVPGLDRCLDIPCHYCHMKGATLFCMHSSVAKDKSCKKAYHLKCAIAAKWALLDLTNNNWHSGSNDSSKKLVAKLKTDRNGKLTVADQKGLLSFCPGHAMDIEVIAANNPGLEIKLWTPIRFSKCLLLEGNILDVDSVELAEFLAAKKFEKALRVGSFILSNVGQVDTFSKGMHTEQYIYPRKYSATRVFWSHTVPLQRTVYCMKILYFDADIAHLDLVQMEYIQDMIFTVHSIVNNEVSKELEGTEDKTLTEPESWQEGPVFRVVALDNPQQPIYAKSLDILYSYISMLSRCLYEQDTRYKARARNCTAFGLTGHQFFGLGIPVVRRAIELLPGSISCMIQLGQEGVKESQNDSTAVSNEPSNPVTAIYKPSYCLPSPKEVVTYVTTLQNVSKHTFKASMSGSSRADAHVISHRRVMESSARSKLLSKAVEYMDGNALADKSAADMYDVDIEAESNKAEEEARRQRFLAMSRAYMLNPNAKLEVRRSHIHNWGLFARIGFEKDDVIVEYIGEKVRSVVADKREAMYEKQGVGSCYLFRLDKEEIIDATFRGGMARFMNHCCEPNACARVLSDSIEANADKHIAIIAARDIKEGEEITYDYKFPIEDVKLKCYCGALRCSGSMN